MPGAFSRLGDCIGRTNQSEAHPGIPKGMMVEVTKPQLGAFFLNLFFA